MSTSTSRLSASAPTWGDLSWVPFVRPGIPIEDVHLTCHRGLLRLRARRGRSADATRTEFDCGPVARTVALPTGARVDQVTARYAGGILEIVVPLTPPEDE